MRHFQLHDCRANYTTRPPTGSKVAELLFPHTVSPGGKSTSCFSHIHANLYTIIFQFSVRCGEGNHFIAKELKRLSFPCIRLDAKQRKWPGTCHDCPTRLHDFRWDACLALYTNSRNCIGSCIE